MTDLDRLLDAAVADERITDEDAETVRQFVDFLEDPDVGPAGAPLPISALRRHQHLLGLTDAQLDEAERRRTAAEPPPGTSTNG